MGDPSKLLAMLQGDTLSSRREFLKRSAIMGASVPALGSLLAACGGDDDDSDDGADGEATEAEREMESTIPTPAGSGGGDEPTEEAGGESTEAVGGESTEAAGGDATEEPEGGATEETSGGESTDGEAVQGGKLILMGHEGVESLSPDKTGPTVNWSVVTQIMNSMAQMDPWYEYQPTLAESWEISDDGLQYTFALRDGVPFHDGETFSSADVKYTFDYYGNPDNAMVTASDFASIESTEAPDDLTAVVNLTAPNAAFITQAASSFIVPQHVHEPIGDDAFGRAPIGTGAFMLTGPDMYDPAGFVELVAFDDHFRGRPHLDGFRINTVPEPSVRAIALETGDADSSVWSLNTDDNIRLRDSGDFTTYITSSTSVNNMPLDCESPQFKEREVRQAMMYAIDRDSIVENLWQGLAVKAITNLSPAVAYYFNPDVAVKYDYDPEKAMQILDDAGWVPGDDGIRAKDGVSLSWTCAIIAGDQARRPIAEAVQQWVSEIGCSMEIVESTDMSGTLRDHENQMGLHNWTYGGSGGDPDASSVLHSQYSGERTHYSNPEMDDLLDRGLQESDPEARREIYNDVQRIFTEDVPILYLQYWDWFVFFNPRVKGLPADDVLTGSQIYNMAHTFWIEEV